MSISVRWHPAEVDHHLLCLAEDDMQVVQFTVVSKVGDDLFVLQIVPLRYTPDTGFIARERMEVAASPLCTG